jgi:hypothetical protein
MGSHEAAKLTKQSAPEMEVLVVTTKFTKDTKGNTKILNRR